MKKVINIATKTFATLLLAATMVNFVPTISGGSNVVSACSTTDECNSELDRLAAEREQKKAEIRGFEDSADGVQNKIIGLQDEIALIDQEIVALDNSIANIDTQIATLEADIKSKDELIRSRMEKMQLTNKGNVYLDFLINSSSLTDLLRRADAVESVTAYDKELIHQISEQKKEITAFQAQQEEQRQTQTTKRTETEGIIAEQETLKADFKAKIAASQASVSDAELSAADVQNQIDKLEQLRKEQEEREKEEQNNNNNSGGSETGGGSGGGSESGGGGSGVPSGSGWTIPTSRGTVTCSFGCYNDHIGTDIGNYGGSNVLAAATGIVVYTAGGCYEGNHSCNGGFGNYIAISHRIDGRDYVTVYAHLASIGVSTWQSVSAGQYIGYMGNTGDSYGTHLHFEVLQDISYMPGSKSERRAHAINSIYVIPYPNGGSEWSSSW